VSKSLLRRELDRDSAQRWGLVLAMCLEHEAPSAPKAARSIKRMIRRRKNPALIANGGKP